MNKYKIIIAGILITAAFVFISKNNVTKKPLAKKATKTTESVVARKHPSSFPRNSDICSPTNNTNQNPVTPVDEKPIPDKSYFSEDQFINIANCSLAKKNVSIDDRTSSIKYLKGKVIVTFMPKWEEGTPRPRAGRFIVTIDENTGEVIDSVIWR